MATSWNLSAINEYISWLFKEYKGLLEKRQPISPLRIINAIPTKNGEETLFKVQFVGKNICVNVPATELYSDDSILENFSKKDIKKIVEAAKDDKATSIYNKENSVYFSEVTFDRSIKSRLYSLKCKRGNLSFLKKLTALDIIAERDLLMSMDKENILDVSFQAGKESVAKEQELFKRKEN